MKTPTVYKRPGTQWWYFSWYNNGKRYRRSCKEWGLDTSLHSEDEALRSVMGHLGLVPLDVDDTPKADTLKWFLKDSTRRLEREGKRDGTILLYQGAIKRLIELLGDYYLLSNVKRFHVGQFQDHLLKKGNSPAFINLNCRHLRASFERLVDDEILEKNPFRKFKALPADNRIRHLNETDVKKFLAVVKKEPKEEYRRLVYIYLFTGRRRREILEIERCDIDLKKNTVWIKNIKDRRHSRQLIEIPKAVREDFQWFMNRTISNHPFRILRPDSVTRIVRQYMDAAGLPKDLHLHSLRHTFVSMALRHGADIWQIKEHLGHSTVLVTEQYAHERAQEEIDIGIKITEYR